MIGAGTPGKGPAMTGLATDLRQPDSYTNGRVPHSQPARASIKVLLQANIVDVWRDILQRNESGSGFESTREIYRSVPAREYKESENFIFNARGILTFQSYDCMDNIGEFRRPPRRLLPKCNPPR